MQPTRRVKRERDSEPEVPRRQSRRLLTRSQSKHEDLTLEERAIQEVYKPHILLITRYLCYILGQRRRRKITSTRTSKGNKTAAS